MIRVRSGYSFRRAVGSVADIADQCAMLGPDYNPATLTDFCSTYGWVKWDQECRNRGVFPVFGVEIPVSPDPLAKRPVWGAWVFLPQDTLGPLNRLLETACFQTRKIPMLSCDQAVNAEGVVKIIGPNADPEWAVGYDDIYIAIGPETSTEYALPFIRREIPPIAAGDNRYITPEAKPLFEVAAKDEVAQEWDQSILSVAQWRKTVQAFPQDTIDLALENSLAVRHRAQFAQILRPELIRIKQPTDLEAVCKASAPVSEGEVDLDDPNYSARLEHELQVIRSKNFEDYFEIVARIVQWAHTRMLVGPGRGSAAGSLVCYLLGITTIDPIKHGLMFERFIDETRDDLPDIDIDFPDTRRGEVIQFVRDNFGHDKVAQLGTVAKYGEKSAPLRELIGHPAHASTHASGIVVCDQPVSDTVPVNPLNGTAMIDKDDAETLGMLKIDLLGLIQLSILENILALTGLTRHDLFEIPLDDPKTFEVLNLGRTAGVFHLDGYAVKKAMSRITVSAFDDIAQVIALARPGPLQSGATDEWINRRNGNARITYLHPCLEPYLKDTLGAVTFQEQIIKIAREIGGLEWTEISDLRRAISKTYGPEHLAKYKSVFVDGAERCGMSNLGARSFFATITAFGAWAMNKSHCVCYAQVAVWCAYLKARYPLEFAVATLNHRKDKEKQVALLRELKEQGFGYYPADPKRAGREWEISAEGNAVVAPLTSIKGIGERHCEAIITARRRKEPLPPALEKRLGKPVSDIDLI